jgi:hypothetical protein
MFRSELGIWPSAFIPDFGGLLHYVYGNCTDRGCRLRRLLAEFAACVVEDVSGLERWLMLLEEVPAFAADLVNLIMDRAGYCRANSRSALLATLEACIEGYKSLGKASILHSASGTAACWQTVLAKENLSVKKSSKSGWGNMMYVKMVMRAK